MTDRVARIHAVRRPWCLLLSAKLLFLGLLSQPVSATITLSQANGESLTLPAPSKRIVTLAPNLAELVFAAGAGDHLQAVVEYSDYPAQVSQIPRVGNAFRIDLERVVELKPDLVIGWKSGNPQTALQKLTQLGLTVWQIEITRPEEIADAVENIARAAGTLTRGTEVASHLRKRLGLLKRQNAGKTPVDFFYQIATHPLYTINGQHIISYSLEICGGRNVFANLPTLAPQVSRESVILANPRAIIAPKMAEYPQALKVWEDWPQLQAVHNQALFYLPADEISRAAPRLLDSIELACTLLDKIRKSNSQQDNNL